jgi:UrcA family protein
MTTKFFRATAFVIALVSTASAVRAADVSAGLRTEQVKYADLDLGSTADRTELQQRVRSAASRVCDLGGMATLEDFGSSYRCYSGAVRDGIHQMDRLIAASSSGSAVAALALIISAN